MNRRGFVRASLGAVGAALAAPAAALAGQSELDRIRRLVYGIAEQKTELARLKIIYHDLRSQVKPVVFGHVRNVRVNPVAPGSLVYRFHEGVLASVGAVYDKGIPLVRAEGKSVPAGHFRDNGDGTFTLGAEPAGVVTADCRNCIGEPHIFDVNELAGAADREALRRAGLLATGGS